MFVIGQEKTYLASKLILNIYIHEYEKENLRLEHLNNKVSMVLVLCGVLLPIILKYLDFREIIVQSKPDTIECNWVLSQAFGILLQLSVVILFFLTIVELINVLRKKQYKVINIATPIDEEIGKDSEDVAGWYLVAQYYEIIDINRKLNDERYEIYEKALNKLKAVMAGILIIELFRNNLLIVL